MSDDQSAGVSCPSAQPDMEGARIFGVIAGTPEEPRVAYLRTTITAAEAPALPAAVNPTQVYRFGARCEEQRCVHYDGRRCMLARRIVETLDEVVDVLPPCLIRSTCRWYAEEGGAACRRCPQVVTVIAEGDDKLNRAARPAVAPVMSAAPVDTGSAGYAR